MLRGLDTQDDYVDYQDIAATVDLKHAYRYMVGWALTLKDYSCFPSRHGHIKDFRFMRGTDWDFSFIPNRNWLLFYFRKPCLRLSKYSKTEILRYFPEAEETNGGEFKVRIARLDDAVRIAGFVEGPCVQDPVKTCSGKAVRDNS